MPSIDIFKEPTPKIDLLVTDIKMPGISGLELAHHFAGVTILFISAEPALLRLMPSGSHFLGKPFDHKWLMREVRELLSDGGQGR